MVPSVVSGTSACKSASVSTSRVPARALIVSGFHSSAVTPVFAEESWRYASASLLLTIPAATAPARKPMRRRRFMARGSRVGSKKVISTSSLVQLRTTMGSPRPGFRLLRRDRGGAILDGVLTWDDLLPVTAESKLSRIRPAWVQIFKQG